MKLQENACYEKGKLCINVGQVGGTEWDYSLLPVKCCPKAGANLFSLMCKCLQGS